MGLNPGQVKLLEKLNTATKHELCKLPGIGGATAGRIEQARPLRSWKHLARLGFAEGKVAKLMQHLSPDPQQLQSARDTPVAEVQAVHEPDEEFDESGDELCPETSLNRYHERWKKQKAYFLERFNPRKYYEEAADQASAREYYAALKGDFSFPSLSRLLSQRGRFGGRRAFLFPWMDRHPDGSLRCIYSGRLLSDHGGNLVERCNEEHSFPQSWQAIKAHTGRDNHHIFAAATSVNGLRGNMPFGDAGEVVEEGDWGQKRMLPSGKKLFTPAHNQGALARASLYILVAYPGALDSSKLPPESLEWLIRKAQEDPLSAWERHRNAAAHAHQGVRNAFVDYPHLVAKIDWWDVLSVSPEPSANKRHRV